MRKGIKSTRWQYQRKKGEEDLLCPCLEISYYYWQNMYKGAIARAKRKSWKQFFEGTDLLKLFCTSFNFMKGIVNYCLIPQAIKKPNGSSTKDVEEIIKVFTDHHFRNYNINDDNNFQRNK